MKILRFQIGKKEAIGILKDHLVYEVSSESGTGPQIGPHPELGNFHPLKEVTILPPACPSKVVGVGLNYRDHAVELDMDIPDEPVLFLKPPTTVIGHDGTIICPPESKQVDYEAELAVIVGQAARKILPEDVSEYIAGYTVLNDVTARDLQRKDGQWTRAKSFDTFCPLGPWIETELDPGNQQISMRVNGELRQDSNTRNMIFPVEELFSFISHIMTLNPGDVIATGTPPGVGQIQGGDVAEATVEDVGTLINQVQ
ncbi:MAG: fumarylacetoacetate hydrolase family protein [Euryarchaeota archaeon]|jgi:2-keto-4-pentenoate hydratase/2-oxohepta-3-ene-1,7-dioic acid hydratase in catechol pathway|nr:fumarylacetoacetate hydrolase family protein [Euryarchaeota archaeon]